MPPLQVADVGTDAGAAGAAGAPADRNAWKCRSDGLAAVAVSCIHGCAVQAMIDPERFDTDGYLAAVRGMVGQLA